MNLSQKYFRMISQIVKNMPCYCCKNKTDLLVCTYLFAKILNDLESTSITFPFLFSMGWNNSLDNEPFTKVLLYSFTWENTKCFYSKEMMDLLIFFYLHGINWKRSNHHNICSLNKNGMNNSMDNEPFWKVLLFNFTDDEENAMFL